MISMQYKGRMIMITEGNDAIYRRRVQKLELYLEDNIKTL